MPKFELSAHPHSKTETTRVSGWGGIRFQAYPGQSHKIFKCMFWKDRIQDYQLLHFYCKSHGSI